MDSLTQATLGAAVAAAGWHRPLGRKALLWGAALGTLPDLDIILFPWLDTVQRLYWHRGESHSILLMLPAALATGWLVRKIYARADLSWVRAASVAFLIYATHVLIDFFTIYGTQLLAPLSRHGFGANNLFIIDPLYTLPLLVGCILFALWPAGVGRRANWVGLIASTLYVGWSFAAQAVADRGFQRELARQGIVTERGFTSPTMFNTVLWRHLAQVEDGLIVGYRSLLDNDDSVRFDFIPQRAELVAPWHGTREFNVLAWFSQGYWVADVREDGTVRISDLRFGEIRPDAEAPPEDWGRIFAWELGSTPGGGTELWQLPQQFSNRREAMSAVWRRLRGDKSVW